MKALDKIQIKFANSKPLIRYISANFRDLTYDKKFDLYRQFVKLEPSTFNSQSIKLGMVRGDGEPIRCNHCGYHDFEKLEFFEEDLLCELEVNCRDCKKCTGRWYYGFWD